jgi:hypothetical protein
LIGEEGLALVDRFEDEMEFNEALKASLKLEDDMTEEQAILERSKDRVAEIMGTPLDIRTITAHAEAVQLRDRRAGTTPIIVEQGETLQHAITRTRRTRSDTGTKRPKPEVEKTAPGFITRDQFNLINHLHEKVGVARINLQDCEDATKKAADVFRDAETEYFNYLESITAKK